MASDERVGLVPRLDSFGGPDADDFSKFSRLYDVFYRAVERGVTENKTGEDFSSEFARTGIDGLYVGDVGGDGFFDEDVVSFFQGGEGRCDVVRVLGSDDGEVGEFRLGEEGVCIGKILETTGGECSDEFEA